MECIGTLQKKVGFGRLRWGLELGVSIAESDPELGCRVGGPSGLGLAMCLDWGPE